MADNMFCQARPNRECIDSGDSSPREDKPLDKNHTHKLFDCKAIVIKPIGRYMFVKSMLHAHVHGWPVAGRRK
jgi:hypothetical protein